MLVKGGTGGYYLHSLPGGQMHDTYLRNGPQSANELQGLDWQIEHQDNGPNNGHKKDDPCWSSTMLVELAW